MAKYNIYLLRYNNYYNRIIKKHDTLNEYINAEEVLSVHEGVNFIPNDGINTHHILNYDNSIEPDYALVYDTETDYLTRWFVIESIRERGHQYRVILRRDVIADNYESAISAPCFIEKATINDINDPAIYNAEDIILNKIKTEETLLTDETQVPWIVGYVARDAENISGAINAEMNIEPDSYQFTVNGISNWEHYNKKYYANVYAETLLRVANKLAMGIYGGNQYYGIEYKFNGGINMTGSESSLSALGDDYSDNYTFANSLNKFITRPYQLLDSVNTSAYYNIFNAFINQITMNNVITDEEIQKIDGKFILDSAVQKVYKISIRTTTEDINYAFPEGSEPIVYLKNNINTDGFNLISVGDVRNSFTYQFKATRYEVITTENTTTVNISLGNNRTHLIDQPFDMFAIPAGKVLIKDTALQTGFYSSAEAAYRIAQAIAVKWGDSLYDIQLLPYCPIRQIISLTEYGTIISAGTQNVLISDSNANPLSKLFWADSSKFSFNIYVTLERAQNNILRKKILSITDRYRLCSPNYSAAFDFDVQKNNGVTSWQIDCQYKPYNPYIHVCPTFNAGGLYGGEYNDARGMICGGNFSISRVNDAWISYQLQNKNYEKTFQRQIENLETTQDIARIEQRMNILTGTISAGTTGAMSGAMVGGGIGAAVGGVIGAGASLGGGIVDYQLSERLRDEAKNYTQDLYGYNLENIQALPYTLAKVDAFDPNNKIFPFVEKYTCTDVERTALANKLKYNGMSIGRIGTIAEFLQPEPSYIKGQIIRLESVGDFHIVNTIAGEINKGVFI